MAERVLRSGPVVCPVGKNYIISVPVKKKCLMSVIVGANEYFNHSNGIKRSDVKVQTFTVPKTILDKAGKYSIRFCEVIKRLPYECIKGPEVVYDYNFRPLIKTDDIHMYYLSDCHGIRKEAVMAAEYFDNDLDILILNGDVSSSCATVNEVMLPFDIAYAVTKGELPCIITRGNHDLRGKYSEQLEYLMPTDSGRSYYSVDLGALWFLVLDCGEDKLDTHREYSGTAAFHQMRMDETAFIRSLISSGEYRSEQIRHRIVLSHVPFHFRNTDECRGERPFDIEDDIYREWCGLLNDNVAPDLAIAGHYHKSEICRAEDEENYRKLHCDTIIAGRPDAPNKNMYGAAITICDGGVHVAFTDKNKNVIDEGDIAL